MKRHCDETVTGSKRYRSPFTPERSIFTPERSLPPPSPSPSQASTSSYGSYSYQSQMWVDPRSDPKNHANMNMFQPQNMMMWNNTLYNPMQPPPPLPLERPPVHDTPPPPPPMSHRRNMMNHNHMGRRPMNPFRPDNRGYMNLGPYKKNMHHQNHQNHQNHGPNPHKTGPSMHSNQHPHNMHNALPGPSTSKPKPNETKTEDEKPKPTLKVNKKARRKPMSERYTCKKEWNKEDAIKALTLENAYNHLIKKVPMLILRFPDPELNKALIHSYSSAIETVHFQQPSRARYCFVQLKPDSDIEQVKKDISKIEFGTGKISVENKITRHEVAEVTPEQLDPYTLYVGNLPTKLNVTIFKEKFPSAKRIDIGYAQRTKFTRYAFLHYDCVDDSMAAFKTTYNLTIDARSLVVRFRRNKGSVGLSEKGKKTKKDEGEGAEGDKKEKKVPSGAPLFDDEMVDSKANVKEKAAQLLKQGFGATSSTSSTSSTTDNLINTNVVKQEPVSDDDGNSNDEYGDCVYNEEDEDYIQSDFDNSDNEFDENITNDFGVCHWERDDAPMVVKTEKPDSENLSDSETNNGDNDEEINNLFDQLNPDDGLDL